MRSQKTQLLWMLRVWVPEPNMNSQSSLPARATAAKSQKHFQHVRLCLKHTKLFVTALKLCFFVLLSLTVFYFVTYYITPCFWIFSLVGLSWNFLTVVVGAVANVLCDYDGYYEILSDYHACFMLFWVDVNGISLLTVLF